MMGSGEFGRNVAFGFAAESSYNEAWGSPTLVGVYINPEPDFGMNLNIIREPHAHGLSMQQAYDLVNGVKNGTIRVSGQLPKEGLGWLLASLFGKVTTAANGAYYTHTFHPGLTHDPVSLKMILNNAILDNAGSATENALRLRGCKIRNVEFVFEINRPVVWTAEIVGGTWEIVQTRGSITVPVPAGSENPFWFFNPTTYTMSMGETEWISMTVRFESMLADGEEDSYIWGDDERQRLYRASSEDAFKMTCTGRRIIDDTVLIQLYDGITAFSVIAGSQPGYYYKLYAATLKPTSYRKIPRGLGIVQEEVTAEAYLTSAITEVYMIYEDKQSAPATQGF